MSEFWARKIRTYFAKLDVNNDGFVSKKDIEELADRLYDATNISADQRESIKERFVNTWRKYMKSAGSDDNGLLTPSILIASLDQQRNDSEFKEVYLKQCRSRFDVWDVNGDGYLSEDECASSYAAIGFQDTSFVHAAFEYMDLNKDGKLSLKEYSSALLEYLISEDEHLLWGPLV